MEHLFFMFLDHTQQRSTVGRTPLDEWSARRRVLYLTTHNTHNKQISMPPMGFEPNISAGERPQDAHHLVKAINYETPYWTMKFSTVASWTVCCALIKKSGTISSVPTEKSIKAIFNGSRIRLLTTNKVKRILSLLIDLGLRQSRCWTRTYRRLQKKTASK
jgi:hypothetical protein